MKIFLNPGHGIKNLGNIDTGAIGSSGLKEYIKTTEICNIIANKFTTKTSGIKIKVYQDGDLDDISNTANTWMSDYFFSIHCNSSIDPSAHGIETYAFSPNSKGNKLAKSIQNELIIVTGLTDRGVKFANYHVLRETIMPAVLIEIGFISNPNEESLMNDPSWDEKVAEAIFKGICNELEIKIIDKQIIATSESSTPIIIPETEITILGTETITVEQCNQFIKKVNPNAIDIAQYYKKYGEILGIKWGYAVAQMIKETGYLKYYGDVQSSQNNFCGLGATGGVKGASFDTPELGVLAHMEHLFAYASKDELPSNLQKIDPRFHLVTRGIAPYWTSLNGKWAVPGTTYGQDIIKIYNDMANEVVEEKEKYEIPTGNNITSLNGGYGWIESLPDQKRVIIHASKYDYISIGEEGIYLYAKDKDCIKLI